MKRIYLGLLFCLVLLLTGCSSKYEGYWCTYDEVATIVVLMEDGYQEKDKLAIEDKVSNYENVNSTTFYTKDDYANQLNQDASQIEIYATYIVTFDSMENIGTYVEELNNLNGVHKAEQSYAKNNISLFYLDGNGKYTYTNSDEATEKDWEKGKYKENKGVLIFTPEDKDKTSKMLYPKDKYLCGDASCSKIYGKSNATCTSKE